MASTPRSIARTSGEGMSKKESRGCRNHYPSRSPPYPLFLVDLNFSAPSDFQRRFNAQTQPAVRVAKRSTCDIGRGAPCAGPSMRRWTGWLAAAANACIQPKVIPADALWKRKARSEAQQGRTKFGLTPTRNRGKSNIGGRDSLPRNGRELVHRYEVHRNVRQRHHHKRPLPHPRVRHGEVG